MANHSRAQREREEALEGLLFIRKMRREDIYPLVKDLQEKDEPEKARLFRRYVRGFEQVEKVLKRGVSARTFESESTPSEKGRSPRTSAPMEISTAEAAELLNVSPQCVTAWCRRGELVARREKGGWRVDRDSAEAKYGERRAA